MRKQCFRYIFVLLSCLVLSGCGEKLTEEQLVTKSREAELNADYEEAKRYYQKLVEEFPQNNQVESARLKIALFDSAESLPQERLLKAIQMYESREQFKDALILYNGLLARFPKYEKRDELLQKIGLVYLNNQEQYQRAVDSYQRLLQDYPESKHAAQAQFMVGYIYANHIKDLDKARLAYDTFKQKYPQHELMPSVDWELEHLGKDIGDLDFVVTSKGETPASDGQPEISDKRPASGPNAVPPQK